MPSSRAPSDAAPAALPDAPVRFGRFELQPLEGRLLVDGEPAALGGRAFDVLRLLVARGGALATRNDLIEFAWPQVVVEENNLSVQINALRRLLGAEVIVTVPGRGYRLGLAVQPVADATPGGAAVASAAATAPPVAAPPTHLPVGLPDLLGREPDLAALRALAAAHRLVTVVGAGGVGKSRLAQALLHEHAATAHGRVCWVDLHAAPDAQALPALVGSALGLPRAPGDPLGTLLRAAAGLELMVALDNAETQLAAVAALAQALLDALPGLRLVVTSQAPLRVSAERVLHLRPLPVPGPDVPSAEARTYGAVALLADRAAAVDSRWTLTDAQLPLAVQLCRRLDGLPLAIELAAARLPVMGLTRLVDSLDDRLRLLTANRNRHAPARQQTLRDTLLWSYGLLGPLEQALFRQLAVAGDGVSLSLAQGLMAGDDAAPDPWSVVDALDQLVQGSLVEAVCEDPSELPRYRLLESPRALALELLRRAGDEAAARQRHALAVRDEYERHEQALMDGRLTVHDWRRDGHALAADAQQAWAWAQGAGEPLLALQLARALVARAQDPRHVELAAAVQLCVTAFEEDEGLDPRLACRTWLALDRTAFGLPPRGRAATRRALNLARSLGATDEERWLHGAVACEAARNCAAEGRLDDAQTLLAEAALLEDPAWPPVRLRLRPRAQAFVAMAQGRPDAALQHLRRVLALGLAAGDPSLATRLNIADMELEAGDAAAAVASGRALLDALDGVRAVELQALARLNLAAAHLALDQVDAARPLLAAAWRSARHLEHADDHRARCLRLAALAAALEGRLPDAARLTGAAGALRPLAEGDLSGHDAAQQARCLRLLADALGSAPAQALQREGAALDVARLRDLAFPPPEERGSPVSHL